MPLVANAQYERFAQEYVARGCRRAAAVQAAVAAGWPADAHKNTIYQVLNNPVVADRIRELTAEHFGELGISAHKTFEAIGQIAFVDPGELFDEMGQLRPVSDLPPGVRAAIASIDVETRWEGSGEDAVPITVKKIRFWDKQTALGLLARHFKIVGDEKEGINALAGELANRLAAARRRRAAAEIIDEVTDVNPQVKVDSLLDVTPPVLSPLPAMSPVTLEHDDDDALWKPHPIA